MFQLQQKVIWLNIAFNRIEEGVVTGISRGRTPGLFINNQHHPEDILFDIHALPDQPESREFLKYKQKVLLKHRRELQKLKEQQEVLSEYFRQRDEK